jgi:hypothetical protein
MLPVPLEVFIKVVVVVLAVIVVVLQTKIIGFGYSQPAVPFSLAILALHYITFYITTIYVVNLLGDNSHSPFFTDWSLLLRLHSLVTLALISVIRYLRYKSIAEQIGG